jgi:hypothetical protein
MGMGVVTVVSDAFGRGKWEHTSNHNNWAKTGGLDGPSALLEGFEMGKENPDDPTKWRNVAGSAPKSELEFRAQNFAKDEMSVVYKMMQRPVFGCRFRCRSNRECGRWYLVISASESRRGGWTDAKKKRKKDANKRKNKRSRDSQ